jgi:glycosyltransferase XagB
LPSGKAGISAKLGYHNANQNLITRWFTVEYAMWFSQLLPGLVRQGTPLPLGGTSNHFRREALEAVGAWDPYNVTEDADLGIRLHRAGYRTQVIETVTLEEANSDFVNWVKQRSRWYKGYMQTWLVHMRHPRRLWGDVGGWGFVGFNLFVGGTPLLALLNPVFWVMTVSWFLFHPDFIVSIFPGWLYYVSLLCLLIGNFAFVYASMVAARAAGSPALVLAALLSPMYWVMMSIAAIKAVIQLFHAPSFWEKTAHGLDRPSDERVLERAAA